MEKRAGGVAALLAVVLVTAWMFAVGYNESSWLSWVDLAVGVIVLGGVATTTSPDLQGTATWPMAGFVLIGMWLFALATHSPHWLAWLNFGVGLAFVLLTFGWLLVSAEGPRWQRRHAHV